MTIYGKGANEKGRVFLHGTPGISQSHNPRHKNYIVTFDSHLMARKMTSLINISAD